MMQLIAKTFFGLEGVLAEELKALGASNIQLLKRAVHFEGDKALMYRANLELRTALRILLPIRSFRARNPEELYRQVLRVNWSKYLNIDQTFAIDAVTNSEFFRHSKFAALKTKDAIADQFRKRSGRRPDVNPHYPDVRINLHIFNQQCTLSLDSSGDSLHKRGYRTDSTTAPINEALAAGMILLSGWRGETDFLDPMCGSGTLLIEAAMIAGNIAPQFQRKAFGFLRWKNFDRKIWTEVKAQEKQRRRPIACQILGADKDFKAVSAAGHNSYAVQLEAHIKVQRSTFAKLPPPEAPGMLITNPPYDERLQSADIGALYKSIGDRLKQAYPGWVAWMISSNMPALKKVGLKAAKKYILFNGPLECKFQKYDLYKGSREEKHNNMVQD